MDRWRETLDTGLLAWGLLFPVMSWITLPWAWWTRRKTGRNCSAVLIPFFGPFILTVWVLAFRRPAWYIPLVWIADPATVFYLWVMPSILKDIRNSRKTPPPEEKQP